jgi:uncharacterized membrane protein YkoI
MGFRAAIIGFLALTWPAVTADAQSRGFASAGGEVVSRMTARVPGVTAEQKVRLRVSGDSAQRIALGDFAWKGRVISLEIDEEDTRLYWDVKIEPDSKPGNVVRYRVDATNGGILGIKEFARVARRP